MDGLKFYELFYCVAFFTVAKTYSLPYQSTGGKCRDDHGEYIPTDSSLCCSRCKPGFHLVRECSSGNDTVCEPCSEGTYMDAMTFHSNCFSCRTCIQSKHQLYSKNCTSVNNAECECKAGWTCSSVGSNQLCSLCKRLRQCPPGMGMNKTKKICVSCPEGYFSNETSAQPCHPHTLCVMGTVVLHPGNSTNDTVCVPVDSSTSAVTTGYPTSQTAPDLSDPSDPSTMSSPSDSQPTPLGTQHPNKPVPTLWIVLGAVVMLLVMLTMTAFVISHRKGSTKPLIKEVKPEQASEAGLYFSKTEHQRLLEGKTDPSTSSASDSHSQSTGTSQDSIHTEQPVVSSPCVNVNITATFNCHLNPTTGSCSIPIVPLAEPQPVQSEPPLSQEEQLRVSCEEENSKDAVQPVQVSGMCVS